MDSKSISGQSSTNLHTSFSSFGCFGFGFDRYFVTFSSFDADVRRFDRWSRWNLWSQCILFELCLFSHQNSADHQHRFCCSSSGCCNDQFSFSNNRQHTKSTTSNFTKSNNGRQTTRKFSKTFRSSTNVHFDVRHLKSFFRHFSSGDALPIHRGDTRSSTTFYTRSTFNGDRWCDSNVKLRLEFLFTLFNIKTFSSRIFTHFSMELRKSMRSVSSTIFIFEKVCSK